MGDVGDWSIVGCPTGFVGLVRVANRQNLIRVASEFFLLPGQIVIFSSSLGHLNIFSFL